MRWLTRHYGAHPLHLLTLAASFALTGYAARQLFANRLVMTMAWFVGAAIAHDLILFPLYSVADRAVLRLGRNRRGQLPAVPAANYVRVPLFLSAVLFLVFAPSILRRSHTYTASTTLPYGVFLRNWLLITGPVLLASAMAYAVRLRRHRESSPRPRPSTRGRART